MEGLIPIAIAVAWMAVVASSTSSSLIISSFELLDDPYDLPLLPQGYPSSLDVLLPRQNTASHSRQSRPQLTVIRYSPILSSSVGRADLSSRGPVILCRPLLSASLAAPLKLSQGHGHGS